jgi:GntR family transcriptional regulator
MQHLANALAVLIVHVYIHTMHGAPLVVSKASGVPFYRQLRDQLDDRIRSGVLPPGYALPSIRELAVQLSVSVITVKSAYEELEADGLVSSQQGRGTFVAENALTASKTHFEAQIASELVAIVQRAAGVGIDERKLRALTEAALQKGYKGKK